MNTTLHLEQLNERTVPSVAPVIPGWTDATESALLYADNDLYPDTAVIALSGGSAHLMVYSGAKGHEVLLNTIVFDPNFRGGGHLGVVPSDTGSEHRGPDHLLVVPGPGGGPVVAQFDFDASSGKLTQSASFFAPYAQSFRGGLFVSEGDVNRDGVPDALFLPAEGGGPNLVSVDMRTHETELSIWVGDAGDFSGKTQFLPDAGTITYKGHEAIAVSRADVVTVWALDGTGEL